MAQLPPRAPATDAAPDSRVGGLLSYKMLHVLGTGSFGEVRAATDRRSGKRVAIKTIDRSKVSDVSEVDRVAREYFILTGLNHRNVIRFIEVFLDETKLYLVMEFARASPDSLASPRLLLANSRV